METNYAGKKIYVHVCRECTRRMLDAKKISNFLELNEYNVVDNPKGADLVIVSTCAYIDTYEDIAIKTIDDFKKQGKEIIVFGCLPVINKVRLKKVHRGISIATKDINEIEKIFKPKFVRFDDVDDYLCTTDEQMNRVLYQKIRLKEKMRYLLWKSSRMKSFDIRNRYNLFKFERKWKDWKNVFIIRTSWGCLGNCSYCAVKDAIGKFRSKPMEQCLKEFEIGLKMGYKHFMLNAADLGAYGVDINTTFPELLEKMLNFDGDFLLNLHNLNINWVIKYQRQLIQLFRNKHIFSATFCVQSGSPRILRKMNRYDKIDEIKKVLMELKKSNKVFEFRFIVGFPGETERDFRETVEFLKDVSADTFVSLTPYSDRPNIEASKMNGKVPLKEIEKRIDYAIKALKNTAIESEIDYKVFEKSKAS